LLKDDDSKEKTEVMEIAAPKLLDGMKEHVIRTLEVIRGVDYAAVETLIRKLFSAYQERRHVFIFGNGGSGSTASHFAEDLAKSPIRDRLKQKRRLRVLSLTDCTPFITALGNDWGYDTVFREQLATNAEPGDLAIGFSGSGNSPNILSAIEWARENDLYTVGLTGFDGGKLRSMVHTSIHFPISDMEIAENAHLIVMHMAVGGLRRLVNG